MAENVDLTGFLASRICHDLVSPVGAVVNGTDLVREIGAGEVSDEIAMISQSAARASALLQFYRIAFGVADCDAALSRNTLEAQATRTLASPKIDMDWHGLQGPPMTRAQARLLFQMLMCARAVGGMRGRIAVRLDSGDGFPISITVQSSGALPGTPSLNQDALRLLVKEPQAVEVSARVIEFALVHRSARDLQVVLSVSTNGEGARIVAARR